MEESPSLEELMTKFIQTSEARHQSTKATLHNQEASIHNLETQVGHIAKMPSKRPDGSLPRNLETNLREQVKAMTLRSDKELLLAYKDKCKEGIINVGVNLQDKTSDHDGSNEKSQPLKEYQPGVPYQAQLKKEKKNEYYGKFLELFK